MNDSYNARFQSIPISFADEINLDLFYSVSYVDALVRNIIDDLFDIADQLKANKLSLYINQPLCYISRKRTYPI